MVLIIFDMRDCVQVTMGFDTARFVDEVDAELICSICHGVLEDPRQVHILISFTTGRLVAWWGAGVVICLDQGADLHMAQLKPLPLTVSCFSEIQIDFTFVVPEKGRYMCVCVCVCACVRACVRACVLQLAFICMT